MMPRKGECLLTDAQQAETVARYSAGDTCRQIADAFSVSDGTIRSLIKKAGIMRDKRAAQSTRYQDRADADAETMRDICRRYSAGEGLQRIAEALGWGAGNHPRVRRVLLACGIPLRGLREAAFARWGTEIAVISVERWREIYWGKDQPSMEQIARHFGISPNTVKRYLLAAGITLRTAAQQEKIDLARDRRPLPDNPNRAANLRRPAKNPWAGPRKANHQAKLAAAARDRAATSYVTTPCVWCGAPVKRTLYEVKAGERRGCSAQHSRRATDWTRLFGAEEPRPVLLSILRERSAGKPRTYEHLERLAAEVGAGENEIIALLLEAESS